MEQIIWKDNTLAYILPNTPMPEKTFFLTPPELELQVGYVVYPGGGMIAAHNHVPVTRKIERTCEVIVVTKGSCEVDLYADEQQVVASRELREGDVIVVVSGGHGFRMHEDTVLLEVKQGPYFGLSEKILLR